MSTVYQYNSVGYYQYETQAFNGLMPNNTTDVQPTLQKGFIPKWNGTAWEQVENHKDEEGYVNGEPFTIKEYGAYPDGWSKEKPPPTLAEAKTAKLAEITIERDKREQAGFEYMGKVFDSDATSVQRLTVAGQAASLALATGQPFEVVWTVQDDTIITMNAEQMLGVIPAMADHANTLHQEARELKAAVNAATTLKKVEAVKW